MGDKYEGRKFNTTFKAKELPEDTRTAEIMDWGEKLHAMGLLPKEAGGFAGNFSFRNSRGFIITAGGVHKDKLNPRNFVQILSCNIETKNVVAEGEMEPSSETMAHNLIYSERPDIHAIIHVHDDLVLEKARELGVKVTKKKHPYGTPELAREIVKTLKHDRYIGVKGHGVISLGKSLWEAGKLIMAVHEDAEKHSGN
jgi:L-fuculose-phosphate aldolase